MNQVYSQAREIAMNETKRIEVENRERWLIDQNSIRDYEREQGKLEVAINAIKENLSVELISKLTGFEIKFIENLKRDSRK